MIMRAKQFAAGLAVAMLLSAAAHAQTAQPAAKGPPNALQGFSQNRDQPVQIDAATLEVRDKDKVATFSGDVRVKQGDVGLRSQTLVVFYEQDDDKKDDKAKPAGQPMVAATPGPGGQQKIKRLEARGAVVVTQKDQTVTGSLGVFDMKANTVTLTGTPVVMTQGQNVLRGERLVVDLTSGVSRVESGKGGQGRVQGLFVGSGAGGPGGAGLDSIMKPGGATAPAPATPPPTRLAPPMKLSN